MQDRNFTIKIDDLLTSTTISDTIQFTNKYSTRLPNLSTGISCTIHLQKGDDSTVFVILEDIHFTKEKTCDVCAQEYTQERKVSRISLSCYADYPEESLDEYEVSFSSKNGLINIEDILVQEITLREEIKNMCTNCQNLSIPKEPETVGKNSIVRK